VNGKVFLEACAIGLFGTTIMLGESAKEWQFGTLVRELDRFIKAGPFSYELEGDIKGHGVARSLVFSNTASIGSNLPVSDTSPVEPYLEFSVHAGATRTDIVGRALAAAILRKNREDAGQVFRFKKLEVTTRPKARVYADNMAVGRTQATVTAELSALRVCLPAGPAEK
jgi:diacylglycerol kinase family enzyme